MTNGIKLPQQNVRVDVDYYDDEQKNKLSHYPSAKLIHEIVSNGIEIPSEEFLTYYLFHRKRPGMPGYRNYEELGIKIGKSLSDLEDFIVFNGNSIATASDAGEQDIKITERVGESIGMSVLNRIHNLSEADWGRIPSKGGPYAPQVFDYQIASDGTAIVQLEAKGSSIDFNNLKTSTVSNHKSSIIKRKEAIHNLESTKSYPFPSNLRYGTITVLDKRPDSTIKCWLLDPEPEFAKMPPVKLRLINRMRFLRDWISFISPRSQFASALSTRVSELAVLTDPFELDGIPLLKGTGEPFDIVSTEGFGSTISFLLNKSRVSDGPTSGVITQTSTKALFFLGLRNELAVLAANQNFAEIMKYSALITTIPKTVNCILHKRRYKRFELPDWITEGARESGDYMLFEMRGALTYSQEGLVFGVLPLEV